MSWIIASEMELCSPRGSHSVPHVLEHGIQFSCAALFPRIDSPSEIGTVKTPEGDPQSFGESKTFLDSYTMRHQ
jgi:hypothetical protein